MQRLEAEIGVSGSGSLKEATSIFRIDQTTGASEIGTVIFAYYDIESDRMVAVDTERINVDTGLALSRVSVLDGSGDLPPLIRQERRAESFPSDHALQIRGSRLTTGESEQARKIVR